MSYLDTPRLHFAGQFQVDVSTINNDVRYYDNSAFKDEYQTQAGGGGWNPEGTAIFRLIGCTITGARLGNQRITSSAQDPVIGMALENADDRVFGKLVDLDPQQQMVSQIWGLRLRLTNGIEKVLFAGEYAPAAFTNLWRRQRRSDAPNDQVLGAVYQSVLQDIVWTGTSASKVLDAVRQASADGFLAIDMNVYGYGRDSNIPRYTLGYVAGTIGPHAAGEPKHFVLGRQMIADTPTNPLLPKNSVYTFQCKDRQGQKTLTADFGNCLQIVNSGGELFDQGPLVMAVLKAENDIPLDTVTADQVAILGNVDYRKPDWYAQTAGVQDFDYSADPWCVANIDKRPLLLLSPQTAGRYLVVVQESLGGLYVRADNFVLRLNPAEAGKIIIHASQYGKPLSAAVSFGVTEGTMGGTGAGDRPLDPPVVTPDIGIPPDGIAYPSQLKTDTAGKAVLTVTAGSLKPPNPRGYIDGQLYGIGYELAQQPPQTISNFWNYISVLVFSPLHVPAQATWYADVRPILQQFGNLYPIMSKHLVRLGDYDSVVEHLDILRLAFSLPRENPNHMPVTRDLSDNKRDMILRWMNSPGADGLPLKGTPVPTTAPATPMASIAPIALDLEPLQTRGKTAVMLEYEARQNAKRPS